MTTRAVAFLLLVSGLAHANPASEVATAAEPNNTADLHVSVDYAYEADKSTIRREGVTTDPLAPITQSRDLTFHQFRHVITPRATLGIYHDTFVSFALPIVIQQARELELAKGLQRTDSSTVADGLLPAEGFDANDPGTPLAGNEMFKGRKRSGLTQVHLGLGVAPMSQTRDPTKPTWKLGADVMLAIGKIMKFDALDPASETGVSKGVHELKLWTTFARRFAHTEGHLELFWQVPLRERKGSLFVDPGFGATNTRPGQKGGVLFGLEAYALDDKANKNRISFDVGASVVGHFEGRDYTEMWEVFALAGDSRGTGPLILDSDPTVADIQARSHPGITNYENYLEMTTRFALRAALGNHAKFAVLVDLKWKTDHAITFADAGVDLPTCGSGRCEADENDLVNPGTAEVNPLHAPRIDLVGHRYLSTNNFGVVVGIQGRVVW